MRLYVGNISYETDERRMTEHFTSAGIEVADSRVIRDKENGNKSKGFGFVTLETGKSLDAVLQLFDQSKLDGRIIRVNLARPKEEKGEKLDSKVALGGNKYK